MGAGDVRFQRGQVNLHDAVVVLFRVLFHFGVGGEQVAVFGGDVGQFAPSGGAQVGRHALVVGEHVAGGAQFGAHIADGAFAGGGDGGGAGAEVFNDGVGAAGDGEFVGQLDDDIFGGRPAVHGAGEFDADDLGVADFPGQAGHYVGGVGAAHADGQGTEAAAVDGVGVGADNQRAGEGVFFQHHLVDDAGAGLPEAHTVAAAGRFQELIDFVAFVEGVLQVGRGAHAGLDEVVAVDGGGDGHAVAPGLHELQNRHLTGDILVGYPVGTQVDVAFAGAQVGFGYVVQMRKQQLFRQR